jgi:Na+-driven multidrug efflux pump
MQDRLSKVPQAVFLSGSIMRHVLVMTGTGALGLVAIFLAELIDFRFLTKLADIEVLAAVGYAGPLVFLTMGVAIGLSGSLTGRGAFRRASTC